MTSLRVERVSFAYSNGLVLRDISLEVAPGEMVGLLGPNGSGKTTLIRLASGVLRPGRGEIWLNGTQLSDLRRRQIARRVAVVPQYFHVPFAFTVGEVVMLGRIPFIRPLRGETPADLEAVGRAMAAVGVAHLEGRRFDELSGGERQKVVLAMGLAQEPSLLLLDEPTAHLDITHQVEILGLVQRLNRELGITVVAAMHDLNLAALYFGRLVLLREGEVFADGTPAEVITGDTLRRVYAAPVVVERHPVTGLPHVAVVPAGDAPAASAGAPSPGPDRL